MDDGQRLLRGGRPFATTTHHRQQRQTAVTSGCEPPVAAADGTIVPSPHSFDPTGRLRQVEHGAIYVVIVEQVVLAPHTRVNRHRRRQQRQPRHGPKCNPFFFRHQRRLLQRLLWVVRCGWCWPDRRATRSFHGPVALRGASARLRQLGWIRRGIRVPRGGILQQALTVLPGRCPLGVTALLLGHEPQQEPRLFRCSAGGIREDCRYCAACRWLTACRSTSGVGQVLRPIGSIIGGREEYRTFCIVCIRLALRNCGTDGTRSSGRIGLQSSPQKYLEQVAQGRRSNRGESLGVSKATFLHK